VFTARYELNFTYNLCYSYFHLMPEVPQTLYNPPFIVRLHHNYAVSAAPGTHEEGSSMSFTRGSGRPREYTHPADTLKADSHIACRAHAVPLPCRAAKGLECVFPI
jgi:hypothetical protein